MINKVADLVTFGKNDNGRQEVIAQLQSDTAAEMEGVTSVGEYDLHMGSIDTAIEDGTILVLNSSGEWCDMLNGGKAESAALTKAAASPLTLEKTSEQLKALTDEAITAPTEETEEATEEAAKAATEEETEEEDEAPEPDRAMDSQV